MTSPPHTAKFFSSDLAIHRNDLIEKWGGQFPPSPPRGAATDFISIGKKLVHILDLIDEEIYQEILAKLISFSFSIFNNLQILSNYCKSKIVKVSFQKL